METDEIIDALAFGRATPKTTACLGMYLSPEVVYLAETRRDAAGKISVEHLVRIPVPAAEADKKKEKTDAPATGTTLNTDFLTENPKLTYP